MRENKISNFSFEEKATIYSAKYIFINIDRETIVFRFLVFSSNQSDTP